jgi:hypothetical protein
MCLRLVLLAASATVAEASVAFLFLTRGNLAHAQLWERFFKGAQTSSQWKIFVHAAPGVELNATTVDAALFYGTTLPDSVPVTWGHVSVALAEQRLFAAALGDPTVQRAVLLSESCVPIRPFDFVYRYLMSSESYVDSYVDARTRRYRQALSEEGVPADAWRKGSQWAALTREHLAILANDTHGVLAALVKHPVFASDEHWKATTLQLAGVRHEPRPVTFTRWWPSGTPHPKRYFKNEVLPALVNALHSQREHWRTDVGEHVRCDGPADSPWLAPGEARERGSGAPCWLFMRKLTRLAGEHLATLVEY